MTIIAPAQRTNCNEWISQKKGEVRGQHMMDFIRPWSVICLNTYCCKNLAVNSIPSFVERNWKSSLFLHGTKFALASYQSLEYFVHATTYFVRMFYVHSNHDKNIHVLLRTTRFMRNPKPKFQKAAHHFTSQFFKNCTNLSKTIIIIMYEVRPEILERYRRSSFTYQNMRDYSSQDFVTPTARPSLTRRSLSKRPPGDRSLRIDSWVGGHSPYGVPKPRRSYTIKREIPNPTLWRKHPSLFF